MFKFRPDQEDPFSDAPGTFVEPQPAPQPEPLSVSPLLSEDEDDFATIAKKSEAAKKTKGFLNVAGDVFQSVSDRPSAFEIYKNRAPQKSNMKSMFGAAADTITDPMDTKAKAMAYLKSKREGKLQERTLNQAVAGDDPNSPDSLAMQQQIGGIFPQFSKFLQGKSATQIREMMPILSQKVRGDEDRALRKQEMQLRHEDRRVARADRLDARDMKQKELSASQAKQRGLFEMGRKAEEQYSNAVKDTDNYDPTAVGQVIDNSEWAPNFLKNNKAIEAQAAMSAWVESYLRDASGAAIPPGERMNYAKDFFAMPGDTPDVVKNKQALRQQKMENARIAAGVETGHGPAPSALSAAPQPSPTIQPSTKAAAHPKKSKALEWALANPGNPDAKAILDRLGVDSTTAVGQR